MKEIIIKLPDGMELSLHELYERLYERIHEDTNAVNTEMIVVFKASSFINMCEQVFELEKELKHKRMISRNASSRCKKYKKRYDRYKAEIEKCNAELEAYDNELKICRAEKDAAVNDLEYISSCKTCEFGCNGEYDDDSYECWTCEKNNNNFVWRGVCPANSKDEE